MPDWIFHKLMTCQIELKRSKELRYEKEKNLTCCKKELHAIKTEMFYANEAHNKATTELSEVNATLKQIQTKPRFRMAKNGFCWMPFRTKRNTNDTKIDDKPSDKEGETELQNINITKPDIILPKLHLLAPCFEDINYDSSLNMMEKGWRFGPL